MVEDNSPREGLSDFNEAGFQIMRLNELWLKAEHFANAGFPKKWKFIQDSIFRELYSDVLKMKDLAKIESENNFHLKNIAQARTKGVRYYWLDKRHKFLKRIQDRAGKGSKYSDPDDESFE